MSQKSRKKRKQKAKKVNYKDKTWYEVFAPKSFNKEKIGDIIGLESNIVGRTLDSLLFDFSRDYDDISCKIQFKIDKLNTEAQTCEAIFQGHNYTSDYIRSLVGRGATKIQLIDNYTTKDEFVYRLTTVCVTIRRARSSQQNIIRKIIRDILKEFASTYKHEKFIKGMIYGEFENQIERIAKTIYPLSSCTVIKSKLVAIPEGGEDKEVPDDDFKIVEIDVERSRKSEIQRSERINVKKYTQDREEEDEEEEEEEEEDDKEEELEE
ncbi:MAG: hypothetical protein GF317_01125 [Candidatus Lokiarchaeota archaeon]|nr:hypothetical protein [Candidatus Lokiarchaeota archaeon]MBD3198561.1 hypothetical protein [Candidatus Lokiarchaeota archaeon]